MIRCANRLAQYSAHKSEIDPAIARVLASGAYIHGEKVLSFEREFASHVSVAETIGVGSGTGRLVREISVR